jgi:hypothetical protein
MKFCEWIVYLTHAIGSHYSRNWAIQSTGDHITRCTPQTFSIVAPATTRKSLPGRGFTCTKLQLPSEPLTRGPLPPDPRSLCPLSSTEFVEPPTNKIPGYATVAIDCKHARIVVFERNFPPVVVL